MRALAFILSLQVLTASVGWSVYTHTCLKAAESITSLFHAGCGGHDAGSSPCCGDRSDSCSDGEDCCYDEFRYYGEPMEAAKVPQPTDHEPELRAAPVCLHPVSEGLRITGISLRPAPGPAAIDRHAFLQVFRC